LQSLEDGSDLELKFKAGFGGSQVETEAVTFALRTYRIKAYKDFQDRVTFENEIPLELWPGWRSGTPEPMWGIYTYNDRLNIDPGLSPASGTAFIRTYRYSTLGNATYIFSIKIGREAPGNPSTVVLNVNNIDITPPTLIESIHVIELSGEFTVAPNQESILRINIDTPQSGAAMAIHEILVKLKK
jgi:hypothetical protein